MAGQARAGRADGAEESQTLREPTDFGDGVYPGALVNVTNACNLKCAHCFVYRDPNPNRRRDKMDAATMLHQLRLLREKHGIRYMLFMGGEPMIRKALVLEAMAMFERCSIVTNGTYGIPSVPGHVVCVSLDGPEGPNDKLRGEGVFARVREAVHGRDAADGTTVILQITVTRQNEAHLEEFIAEVAGWPVDGVAFTFYVPTANDRSGLGWDDLKDRDPVIERVIALKRAYPRLVKSNIGALEMMVSDRALEFTGTRGEPCLMRTMLPLYMGEGGRFERTFCCYGNDVDCSRCGAYNVFNFAYQSRTRGRTIFDGY